MGCRPPGRGVRSGSAHRGGVNQGRPWRICTVQPLWWTAWWWNVQSRQRFVEVGGSPVGPVLEVVGVAAPRPAGAAGERAPAVAVLQGAALGVGDGPGQPPEVEGFGAAAQNSGDDGGVAREPAGGGGADRGVGVEHRVPDLLLQPPVIDGDHQQGAAAAPDRCRRGLVEVVVLGGPRRRDG